MGSCNFHAEKMKLFLFFGPLAVTAQEDFSECQKAATRSPDDRYNPMKFYPSCDEDGNYAQVQCLDFIGQCWCSTEDGRFIPGTSVHEKSPYCPTEDEWTSCQKAVLEAESKQPLIGGFIPKCDDKGYCEQRQRSASTGYSWCSEKNTENCNAIPGTESGPGQPDIKCPGDDILRGPIPFNYARAKLYCESAGMYLPEPTDAKRNQELKSYGPTWIDVLPEVSTQTGSYGNWAEKQRTFFMGDGSWQVAPASDVKEFYCVDRKPMQCSQVFDNISQHYLWKVAYPWQKHYHHATEEELKNISKGTRFRYQCPAPPAGSPITTDPYYFRCVRINTEETYLVKCLDGQKCHRFKRQPIDIDDYSDFECNVYGEE